LTGILRNGSWRNILTWSGTSGWFTSGHAELLNCALNICTSFPREELYYHFSTHFPEFVQRIPQYLMASFLRFIPEYLSEIRKKKRS
jgi:hypothetical protein